MISEALENDEQVLDNIRNIVTKKNKKYVLTLTKEIKDNNQITNSVHSDLLQNVKKNLKKIDTKSDESISSIINKLNVKKEEKTLLELLESKIQEWLENNLAEIVRNLAKKEIKNILDNTKKED